MSLTPRTAIQSATSGILLAFALAGCKVGPNYVVPTTRIAEFHNLPVAAAKQDRKAVAIDQWWTGFDDPTLVAIVERALNQNLDLTASIARVEQARAVVKGANAALLPTVNLDASATAQHQSRRNVFGSVAGDSPQYRRDVREYSVGPTASWELDLAGGLRRAEAAASNELQAVVSDQGAIRITVISDAADAYFQIRGYQARLVVAQNQIETDERLLKLVQSRYQAGAAEGREVAQADALLKQARASIPPLRIALEQQMNRLDVLMGDQPGTFARTLEINTDVPSIPAIPGDQHPLDLLRRRPDIIAAERRLAASNERIGAAISDYYPKVSLAGALGFDSVSTNRFFSSKSFQAGGGAGLRWRLFDFGKIDAEVAQARGAYAEALAVYRRAVLRGAEDVENALILLTETEVHTAALEDQVQSLKKSRDLSEQAYRAGSIAPTDVLDADRLLLSAQDQLHASRADSARAAVVVFRSFGGGWDAMSPFDSTKSTAATKPSKAVPVAARLNSEIKEQ